MILATMLTALIGILAGLGTFILSVLYWVGFAIVLAIGIPVMLGNVVISFGIYLIPFVLLYQLIRWALR
jgi:hypothetical protein